MDQEVIVSDYSSNWVAEYKQEKEKLLSILDGLQVTFQHIGSTSVPGLGSKPTIDMMAGVENLQLINDSYKEKLAEVGYEYVHKPEFPDRMFFRKGRWRKGTHHLHIYRVGSENWKNNILFREYLMKYPDTKNDYYRLKKSLEEQYRYDRVAYTANKASFINETIRRAQNDKDLIKYLEEGNSIR